MLILCSFCMFGDSFISSIVKRNLHVTSKLVLFFFFYLGIALALATQTKGKVSIVFLLFPPSILETKCFLIGKIESFSKSMFAFHQVNYSCVCPWTCSVLSFLPFLNHFWLLICLVLPF